MLVFLIVIIAIVLAGVIALGGYFYRNMHFNEMGMKKVNKAGFREKQVTLPDGDVLNYGEGGSGTPLFLIHGQGVAWEDYQDVLPQMAGKYHVFAVDCAGHGQSSHNPENYSAEKMGRQFAWFIRNVIKEPAIVSGHSSGGLLTAWLAANAPEEVKGVLLEDPPFFSCEKDRTEKTFAYQDTFKVAHAFLEQTEAKDYPLYYFHHSKWISFFGKSKDKLLKTVDEYREKNPDSPIKVNYLPPSIMRMFIFLEDFDPRFADTFYDCRWMEGFDHAETLGKITCPSVLIHTNWSFDADGILLAAMSGEDAERAASLIKGCELFKIKSGHDSHSEKPGEFLRALDLLAGRL